MEITITALGGRALTLTVPPDTTVRALKELIQQREGVPVGRQRLLYENGHRTALTDDSRTLGSYGLQQGSRVALVVTEKMEVFVKNDKGKLNTYEVKPDETVGDLKRKVECRESVPVSQQRLVFQGREMSEGRLSDYNVQAHSTIDLCLRLRGG